MTPTTTPVRFPRPFPPPAPLLLLSSLLLLLCSLLPASRAAVSDASPPEFSWGFSSPVNETVGSSAVPTSPYLVLSLPVTARDSRAFINLCNAHPTLTVNFSVGDGSTLALLQPGSALTVGLDNATASAHNVSVWLHGLLLARTTLTGLCIDCVANVTLTERNSTTLTVEQPSYALQFRDRDDNSSLFTSEFILPRSPSSFPIFAAPNAEPAPPISFVLNFTFTIPIASFNFYAVGLLRLVPSSSMLSSHPPLSAAFRPISAPLLHIPYYYTDIILPASATFASGDVLTAMGGFSTNPADLYCCHISDGKDGYFSSCLPADTADSFHCIVPAAVDLFGYNGEQLTVAATYYPRPDKLYPKPYYLRHLRPSGASSDNTFTVDKPAKALAWWDLRGWQMKAIIAGGGMTVVALCLLLSVCAWRKLRQRKRRLAMEAEEQREEGEHEEAADADLTTAIAVSAPPHFLVFSHQPYQAFASISVPAATWYGEEQQDSAIDYRAING